MSDNSAAPGTPPPAVLENERIRLELIDNDKHVRKHFEAGCRHPEIMAFELDEPITRLEDLIKWFDDLKAYKDGIFSIYAIIIKATGDKDSEEMAGILVFQSGALDNADSEIGIIVYPEYQRTFVATNAIGLTLHHLLDAPPAGLGLRRVQWTTSTKNTASRRASERLGFTVEGIKRWSHILPTPKGSNGVDLEPLAKRNGAHQAPGRHSVILSLCWEEWEERRKALDVMMAR